MNILITGASSGIGQALAEVYAGQANTKLFLTGRDAARLSAVADTCRAKGARVDAQVIDVRDEGAMRAFVLESDILASLDLVIANAGVGLTASNEPTTEGLTAARLTHDINVTGVLNTIDPIIPVFAMRGRGHIALMASLAGYAGLASAPMYAATKNFVRAYGSGLRGSLAPHGIKVTTICPGFVDSRITQANTCPMPFFMDTPRAARIIADGIARNASRVAFPWPMVLAVWFLSTLPAALLDLVNRRIPKK